jgi:hypothetical protein
MLTLNLPIRIVCYVDDGVWVAHCLEFDLMGDGPTQPAALADLIAAIELQMQATVDYDNPANLFRPADGTLFARFAAGHDVMAATAVRLRVGPITVESAQVREFADPLAIAG